MISPWLSPPPSPSPPPRLLPVLSRREYKIVLAFKFCSGLRENIWGRRLLESENKRPFLQRVYLDSEYLIRLRIHCLGPISARTRTCEGFSTEIMKLIFKGFNAAARNQQSGRDSGETKINFVLFVDGIEAESLWLSFWVILFWWGDMGGGGG